MGQHILFLTNRLYNKQLNHRQATYNGGENIFYKAFTAELSTFPGLEEVPEGDILQLYKQFRIYPKNQPDERLLPMMAQRLEAQFVVTGDIQKMTEIDTGREVKTELTVLLNIYDGSTGKLLWSTYHKRRGEEYQNVLHYGRVNSLSGLSRRMANEILLLWIENGINQCAP